MLNQCSFIGNLGADPEIRSFANGNKVANLRLAVNETWRDKATGEKKEKTEWITVSVFQEGLIRIVEQYLKKGSKVFVQGKMQTRKYQDQSGADRYSTEIVLQGFNGTLTMLDGAGGGRSEDSGHQRQESGYGAGAGPNSGGDMGGDDIPFAAEWRA
jgi:single-strand DNA-binding protein